MLQAVQPSTLTALVEVRWESWLLGKSSSRDGWRDGRMGIEGGGAARPWWRWTCSSPMVIPGSCRCRRAAWRPDWRQLGALSQRSSELSAQVPMILYPQAAPSLFNVKPTPSASPAHTCFTIIIAASRLTIRVLTRLEVQIYVSKSNKKSSRKKQQKSTRRPGQMKSPTAGPYLERRDPAAYRSSALQWSEGKLRRGGR